MVPIAKASRKAALAVLLVAVVSLALIPSTVLSQLSGTYTIGSTGSYASFTAAVSALTSNGVSGAVTFNVQAGTYTEQISIPAITGASATNTITFNGGTGNASTRILTYNVTSLNGAIVSLNGADYIKFKNLTINSTGTSYGYGFRFTNSADYNEISDCVINLPTNATSAYHIGILASTTTSYSTTGDHGNHNLIENNTITGGYYAIRWNGSSTTDYTTATGNKFIGNTLTDWYYYGMYLYYIGGQLVVRGNTSIQRSTGSATFTIGYAYYIYYPNNGPEISYNYGRAHYSAFYIYYMNNTYASTTNRGKVFNNMGVVQNGTSTNYGLYVNYNKYSDIVYNSIRTSNTTGNAYGIYSYGSSVSYNSKILNNMLSHDGSGTYYPLYVRYPASHSAIDYNIFYRTGTGSNSYYWNATTYTTLAALKAANSSYNQNSSNADPEWFSDIDLHSTSQGAYQNGTPVTGFTDDYDGNTRSTTAPCIGADEYVLTNMAYASSTVTQPNTGYAYSGLPDQDILRIEVTVTGSLSPISATSFSLNTTGTTSASNISTAKIYYTARSDVFDPSTLVGSYSSPSGSFTITGNQALIGPGTTYFWLAYDVAASASTGNYLDAQCTSVTVGGTAYTPSTTNPTGNREIVQPLNGTYTINPTGSGSRNFTSFTNALTALGTYGVNAAVTFEVAAATYNEQLTISPILGASATNTVTFDGGAGNAASRIISYSVTSVAGSVVTFNGADHVRLRNLTINSTNTSYGYCVLFTNPGGDPSDYNEISNCALNVPTNSTSSYHIPLVASSATSSGSNGNWANYNLIKDNTLNSGYYGMMWRGSSTSSLVDNVGNEFIGNTIHNWYYYGVYMYYGAATKLNHNRIEQRRTGTFTSTGGYGIYFYYQNEGPEIIGNYIRSANYVARIYYMNQYRSSTAVRGKFFNNMLLGIGTTSTVYATYLYYPRYTDFVYNSVYSKTSSTGYGLYHLNSASSYDNKVLNNYVVHEGNSTWYPVYTASATNFSDYNYNAYYRIGTGNPSFYWSTTYTSLTALQNGTTTVHDNSVWGNPYFHSPTDLHSNSHVGYQAGVAFAAVTDDYDGDSRGVNPCIGADEYPAPPPENDMSVAEVMINTADLKWAHIEDPAMHSVKAVVANTGLSANPANLTLVYKEGSAPASAVDGVQQTFAPVWNNGKAVLTFTQQLTGLTAGTMPSVYVRHFWAGDEVAANDVAMDNATIEIAKVHGFENFEKMETGQNPLTRDPGYLDLPWSIIDNNGGSTLAVTAGAGNGGNALAMNAPTEAADEWFVTPGADLVAGSSYRIDFDFRNWGGAPVTIQAAWGTTPDPSQMTVFATFADIAPGGFVTAKQLGGGFDPYFNTPFYNGTYFVAMRFTTSGTNAYFAIDNIKLDDNPSPPPKIAFGLPGTDLADYIDNPFQKITVLANYKQPGVINRTYEVQNKIDIYGLNGDFLWDVETSTPWITLTKETPNPTLQGYNLTPPRPRQFQTFTMSVNPSGLAAGTHMGMITFYGILFNDDFPPPANGLVATNEPLNIDIELIITNAGSKSGPSSISQTISTPLTVPGSPYHFADPLTGDPIATVEVTGGQIDAMTITAYPNQLPQNLQRKLFVKRYWQITHTGSGWTANISFPYADIEASMISDKLQLRGVRQPVTLGAWEDPIMGTSSVSDALTNTVKVHDFNEWNIGGNIALSQPYMVAAKGGVAPSAFALEQNYPNPFNPSTAIVFTVAEERGVRLAVYDALGTEVTELVNEVLPVGRYEVQFNASSLPSGTYIYRMQAGDFTATQRMTLSK